MENLNHAKRLILLPPDLKIFLSPSLSVVVAAF